jgi:tetratricopeptide (TPR) repeat protein
MIARPPRRQRRARHQSEFRLSLRGNVEAYLRQFEQARSDVEQAMRLNPRGPSFAQWHNFLADAELGLGHFNKVIDECNKANRRRLSYFLPELEFSRRRRAERRYRSGEGPLAQALRLNPKLSVKWLVGRKPV